MTIRRRFRNRTRRDRRKALLIAGGIPHFSTAEIGTVNGYTVVVTFDKDIAASNYATGVTIKVNSVSQSIVSATRQANHAIVRYVIPIPWHGSDDVITWEYTGGDYESESDATALETVTAQTVTNNIVWASLLDLQADTLSLGLLSTFNDLSGNGPDFTAAGDARPDVQDIGGYKAVVFDGVDDVMTGSNFADNMSSFMVLLIYKYAPGTAGEPLITKGDDLLMTATAGWSYYQSINFSLQSEGAAEYTFTSLDSPPSDAFHVIAWVISTKDSQNIYFDGSLPAQSFFGSGGLTNYSNSEPVRIGATGDVTNGFAAGYLRAAMIVSPAPSSTDRTALETRLGARYGI